MNLEILEDRLVTIIDEQSKLIEWMNFNEGYFSDDEIEWYISAIKESDKQIEELSELIDKVKSLDVPAAKNDRKIII